MNTRKNGVIFRFPVPGDCGRLITCVDGHPRLLTCGDGKLFDSVSLTCLDPDDVPHWFVFIFYVALFETTYFLSFYPGQRSKVILISSKYREILY